MAFVTIDGQSVHTSTLDANNPVEINREHPAIRAFLDASPEWRVALARELLVGTGRVVAAKAHHIAPEVLATSERDWVDGWNDCRAAMMEGE